jgi:hypothetical protein
MSRRHTRADSPTDGRSTIIIVPDEPTLLTPAPNVGPGVRAANEAETNLERDAVSPFKSMARHQFSPCFHLHPPD